MHRNYWRRSPGAGEDRRQPCRPRRGADTALHVTTAELAASPRPRGAQLLVRLQMKLEAAGQPASQPLLALRKDSHHVRTPRAAAAMESARLQCADKLENATGVSTMQMQEAAQRLRPFANCSGLAIACPCSGQRREHTQILQQPIMQEMSSHRRNHVLTSKQ